MINFNIEDTVGNTPLVRLKRLPGKTSNIILVKLEGNDPVGSMAAALRLSATLNNAVIVAIVCDRGDRYLPTGVFNTSDNG